MSSLKTLFKKDMTAGLRQNSFLVMFAITMAFALLSPAVAKFTPELFKLLGQQFAGLADIFPTPTVADAFLQLAANVSQLGVFVLIILFVTAPVKERKKGTYAFLKQAGVGDGEFILSHFFADAVCITVSCAAAFLLFTAETIVLFGGFDAVRALLSFVCILLFFLSFEALALLIGAVSKSPAQSMVLAFVLYFVLSIVEMFDAISWLMPSHLVTWASRLMSAPPDFNLWLSIGTACVLTAAGVFLAGVLFHCGGRTKKNK